MNKQILIVSNLQLVNIRTPKGAEHETGAEAIMEYKCTETGKTVRVLAQKSGAGKFQWLEEHGIVDDENALLINNSGVVMDWSLHSMKHVKEKYI